MASSSFEELRVYQIPENLADEAWRIVLDWEPMARRDALAPMLNAYLNAIGPVPQIPTGPP